MDKLSLKLLKNYSNNKNKQYNNKKCQFPSPWGAISGYYFISLV
jgi:hypothetical protein